MFRLERLDPRTKMGLIVCLSTAAMLTDKLLGLVILLAVTELGMIIGGISLRMQARQAKMALGMVAFLFVLQAVFQQAELGAVLALRLLIVILSALILLTGQPRDYLLGLVQMKVPYEIAYMVLIGLHFFPTLKEEALDVFYSIQLRGTDIKKMSLRGKLRVYFQICLPILSCAMEQAKETAISMEVRAFRSERKRTYMRKLTLKKRDKGILLAAPVLTAVFLLAGCTAGGTQTTGALPQDGMQVVLTATETPEHTQAVSWRSVQNGDGTVWYRKTGETNWQSQPAEVVEVRTGEYYRYKAVIESLEVSTTYEYYVENNGTQSEICRFSTASGDQTNPLTFLFLGDVQYEVRDRDYEIWGSLLANAYRENPDIKLGVLSGDLVESNGDLEDWDGALGQAQRVFRSLPMATVPGNHETSIQPYTYLKMFPLPTGCTDAAGEVYSFDYDNCHFLMLNSCLFMEERKDAMGAEAWNTMMENVRQWIAQDLAQSGAAWNIVVMHHPMYPVSDDNPLYAELRDCWLPTLEQNGADVLLCGHQHVSMHTESQDGILCVMGNSGQKHSHYYTDGMETPSYIQALSTESTYTVFRAESDQLTFTTYNSSGDRVDSGCIKERTQ